MDVLERKRKCYQLNTLLHSLLSSCKIGRHICAGKRFPKIEINSRIRKWIGIIEILPHHSTSPSHHMIISPYDLYPLLHLIPILFSTLSIALSFSVSLGNTKNWFNLSSCFSVMPSRFWSLLYEQ